jgi:hypothetical protein
MRIVLKLKPAIITIKPFSDNSYVCIFPSVYTFVCGLFRQLFLEFEIGDFHYKL